MAMGVDSARSRRCLHPSRVVSSPPPAPREDTHKEHPRRLSFATARKTGINLR